MSSDDQSKLYAMRHSMAHIMASAIQNIYPGVRFGVGPVIEDGFYYDVQLPVVEVGDDKDAAEVMKPMIGEGDLPRIEVEMHKIIKAAEPFERIEMPVLDAIDWARQNGQPYKEELLNDLQRAGTTAVKDLDAQELGLPADGISNVERVSQNCITNKNGQAISQCRLTTFAKNLSAKPRLTNK